MSISSILTQAGPAIGIATTAFWKYHSAARNQRKIGTYTYRDRSGSLSSLSVADSQKSLANVTFRVATCHQARVKAFSLVYRRYREAGLIESNPLKIRVTPYHLEPTTTVLVARAEHEVYGTVTLVQDGRLGLPMEAIFPAEIDQKRSEGLSLAEVSCLALRRGLSRRESWSLFLGLNRLMAQFARNKGVDALVIATHPRHVPIYQRSMGFVQIGGTRTYPSVRNNPAVACCLDFAEVDRNHPPTWEAIFGHPVPPWQLDASSALSMAERSKMQDIADSVDNVFLPLAVA
jgi:hypothetical protein